MDRPENLPAGGADEVSPSGDDLRVLNEVLTLFGSMSPESRGKALEIVATFYGLRPAAASLPAVHHVSVPRPEGSFSEDRSPSPKHFMFEKRPKTDVERVACLGYYLTHYRNTRFFKTLDISTLNTEAAQLKFSNAAFAVENATKLNYLAPATKGAKQLSALGEQFVLALPDRDKARLIMTSARPRRKSRRTSVEGDDARK